MMMDTLTQRNLYISQSLLTCGQRDLLSSFVLITVFTYLYVMLLAYLLVVSGLIFYSLIEIAYFI